MADVDERTAEPVHAPGVSPGMAGSMEEPRSRDQERPRGAGWRHLAAPVTARCYVNNIWVDATVVDVNDETREIRIEWPPLVDPVELTQHHEIVDASHYRPEPALFAKS